jgi:hypothetical protein
MCDHGFMVAGATRLTARAGGVALEGGMLYSNEVIITAGAFAPGQALNFGSLTYITDCNGNLYPLKETMPVDIPRRRSSIGPPRSRPRGPCPAYSTWSRPNPTVLEHR